MSLSRHAVFHHAHFHQTIPSPIGPLFLAGDDAGLRLVALPGRHPPIPEAWIEDGRKLTSACEQLRAYFAGSLHRFELEFAPRGTAFQRAVWDALGDVDYGSVVSYRDIANAIDNPRACRAVGAANGNNPIAIVIPCHRVIGADGSLTGYAGGLRTKQALLTLEREHRTVQRSKIAMHASSFC